MTGRTFKLKANNHEVDVHLDDITLMFFDTTMAMFSSQVGDSDDSFDYFQYKDDEAEWITVRTDEELQTLLFSFEPDDFVEIKLLFNWERLFASLDDDFDLLPPGPKYTVDNVKQCKSFDKSMLYSAEDTKASIGRVVLFGLVDGINLSVDDIGIAVLQFVVRELMPVNGGGVVAGSFHDVGHTSSVVVVPSNSDKMIPTSFDEVLTSSGVVVPRNSYKMVPTSFDEVILTSSGLVVPTNSEKFLPTKSDHMVPTNINKLLPTGANDVATFWADYESLGLTEKLINNVPTKFYATPSNPKLKAINSEAVNKVLATTARFFGTEEETKIYASLVKILLRGLVKGVAHQLGLLNNLSRVGGPNVSVAFDKAKICAINDWLQQHGATTLARLIMTAQKFCQLKRIEISETELKREVATSKSDCKYNIGISKSELKYNYIRPFQMALMKTYNVVANVASKFEITMPKAIDSKSTVCSTYQPRLLHSATKNGLRLTILAILVGSNKSEWDRLFNVEPYNRFKLGKASWFGGARQIVQQIQMDKLQG
ncbi:unnamed protein product [Bursaphelenchus okinawaensis]|uniref:PB1 domain-containing protein n=1 Tax=Bursaphelenchus okinawaensis TaxID=465554 RepID=A0A811JWP8_9BILA|nr:unnamed protein product [Bursaphelenchus okinawaensis]CAG9085776.1 unnamed protein product [Bursaphelenchus okinawaensis]